MLKLSFSLVFLFDELMSDNYIVIPSASTSLIMSFNSGSVGLQPSDLITVPNSELDIVPSLSLSNKLKASLNSTRYVYYLQIIYSYFCVDTTAFSWQNHTLGDHRTSKLNLYILNWWNKIETHEFTVANDLSFIL